MFYYDRIEVPPQCPACKGQDDPETLTEWAVEQSEKMMGRPAGSFPFQTCPSVRVEVPSRGWTIRVTCGCGARFTESLPAPGHGKIIECHACGMRIEVEPSGEEPLRK